MKFSRSISTLTLLFSASVALSACAPTAKIAVEDGETDSQEAAVPAPADALPLPTDPKVDAESAAKILSGYQHLDPSHLVPTKLLAKAVVYFDQNKSRLANKNYIVVVNFSSNSKNKRFFLIDMKSGAVTPYAVAHGRGSDPDNDGYATRFSNLNKSYESSVGFYRTSLVRPTKKHGLGLDLDGLSPTNSNARTRAILVHGSNYSESTWIKKYGHAGRSEGCFAVAESLKTDLINKIKGGALIYADILK